MMNNVYLYYYNDYYEISEYIKKLKIANICWGIDFDEYAILSKDFDNINIIIYKKINILAIQCNKYKGLKDLKLINKFMKVNLLDKRFFNLLVERDFFENLCRIVIDIDILGDDEELVEFNGYKLLNRDIIESFGINDITSISKLKLYSVQPNKYKYLVNFRSTNKLEFSKKFNQIEIKEILFELMNIAKDLMGGEKNRK